jgi:hypothetical protein
LSPEPTTLRLLSWLAARRLDSTFALHIGHCAVTVSVRKYKLKVSRRANENLFIVFIAVNLMLIQISVIVSDFFDEILELKYFNRGDGLSNY